MSKNEIFPYGTYRFKNSNDIVRLCANPDSREFVNIRTASGYVYTMRAETIRYHIEIGTLERWNVDASRTQNKAP